MPKSARKTPALPSGLAQGERAALKLLRFPKPDPDTGIALPKPLCSDRNAQILIQKLRHVEALEARLRAARVEICEQLGLEVRP